MKTQRLLRPTIINEDTTFTTSTIINEGHAVYCINNN